MSRIGKVYESRFRSLLEILGSRQIELDARQLLSEAERRSREKGVSLSRVLIEVHDRLRYEAERAQAGTRSGSGGRKIAPDQGRQWDTNATPRRFLCDAGLGGLARWLRATGYEAIWEPDIDDAELLRRAERLDATVLTTDSLMLERRVLREGIVPVLWVSPDLNVDEQLALVFREWNLPILQSRCMRCGGELQRVEKESVRERIPPRTALWLDEYFVCSRCGQLFWHGTHWHKIQQKLRQTFTQSIPE